MRIVISRFGLWWTLRFGHKDLISTTGDTKKRGWERVAKTCCTASTENPRTFIILMNIRITLIKIITEKSVQSETIIKKKCFPSRVNEGNGQCRTPSCSLVVSGKNNNALPTPHASRRRSTNAFAVVVDVKPSSLYVGVYVLFHRKMRAYTLQI